MYPEPYSEASTTPDHIRDRVSLLVRQQREFFNSGKTQPIDFRLGQLKALRQALLEYEPKINNALKADLNKPAFETYFAEIRLVREEIDYAIQHLRAWAKPQRVAVPAAMQPARAKICPEPLGVVLIVSPWNYPFQLLVSPLVAAMAAGNCALLKPSEVAPSTSQILAELIQTTFDPAYVAIVEGGIAVNQAVLDEKFDHIFFTGGTAIGRIVMAAAAKHLTPVTLELGGKSPCLVDTEIQIEYAARRIVWGKFLNAGQTCVAPDYLLVDRQIKPALLESMLAAVRTFYGENPLHSPDYARIISPKHFDRLTTLLQHGTVLIGGQTHAEQRYIAPTILDQVTWDDPIMQEEIFGPILPVLDYGDLEEAIEQINARPKPLALYLFSRNPALQQRILQSTSSGGVAINDTIMQSAFTTLPFGGVGDSGMGRYHGKAGFDTLSHHKSIFVRSFWLDLPFRYAPYGKKLDWLRRLFG
jgi:acyl-CoA reductase-like NAD-dependent aldehyde dehydrogenase